MHPAEDAVHGLQVPDLPFLDPVQERIHQFLRGDEAAEVRPLALPIREFRLQGFPELLIGGVRREIFQLLDDGVPQELGDGDPVQVQSLPERTVPDLGAMVGIDVGKLAGGMLQVLQQLDALEHLLDGIGA